MSPYIVFIEISPYFEDAFNAVEELGYQLIYCSTSKQNFKNIKNKNVHLIKIHAVTAKEIQDKIELENINLKDIALYYSLKDFYIPLCGHLNQTLENKFYDLKIIETTKDKIKMRKALAGSKCNSNWQSIKENEITDKPIKIDFPLVVKPPMGFSSLGVQKVNHPSELLPALQNCLSTYSKIETSLGKKIHKEVLIEKFITGTEVSVEVFAFNGKIQILGICGKSKMEPPYFEEVSYQLPANILAEDSIRVTESAIEVCQSIGFKNGMAHLEFIFNEKEVVVLDIGLRIGGGGLTHDLIKMAFGINLVKSVLMNLLGKEVEFPLNTIRNDTGLLYLHQINKGGRVKKVMNDETSVKSLSEYKGLQTFVNEGDELTGYPQYSGLPGYTLFQISGQGAEAFFKSSRIIEKCNKDLRIIYEE